MGRLANRFLSLMIVFGMPFLGYAKDHLTTAGVQYSVTGENTVTAFITVKAQGDVYIQETIIIKEKSYHTTRIGRSYPKKNDYIQSVIIPNTVTKIDKYAFRNCSNLSKLVIPNEPCSIDPLAFDGCKSITSVRTHVKGGKIDYLLAAIDPSNPCFNNNVVIIEEEPIIKVDTVYIKPKPDIVQIVEIEEPEPEPEEIDEDIDIDIPSVRVRNDKTFVLIIGNENYKRLDSVPFASNDAKIFKEYCEKTLGIPSQNIDYLTDATHGEMRYGVNSLANKLKAYEDAKAIVYYAGHGIPDEKDKTAYLLPTDGFASDVESGYSLEKLYSTLSSVPSEQVLVFLDACFSGSKREGDMMADNLGTRGVAIKVKETAPTGKLLVFSASTGEETAICDKEHKHGVFTYYLLQCLRRNKGSVDMGSLSEYVTDKVRKRSVLINNGKIQTPTVLPSPSMGDRWREIELK